MNAVPSACFSAVSTVIGLSAETGKYPARPQPPAGAAPNVILRIIGEDLSEKCKVLAMNRAVGGGLIAALANSKAGIR